MAHGAAHGEEDVSDLVTELRTVADGEPLPLNVDPHTAAITALLVCDFVERPEMKDVIAALESAGAVRPAFTARVKSLARGLRELVTRLGGRAFVERKLPERLMDKATALRASMTSGLEAALPGSADVRLWLDAIRRGHGPVDVMFDLRTLSMLYMDHRDVLDGAARAQGASTEPPDEIARAGRRTAAMIEHALRAGETEGQREQRTLLARAWTLFVPAYEELCRVGRFISGPSGRERSFPPLAMIAAHARAKRRPTSLLPPRAPQPILVRNDEPVVLDGDPGVELLSDPPPPPPPLPPPPPPRPPRIEPAAEPVPEHAPELAAILLEPEPAPEPEAAPAAEPEPAPAPPVADERRAPRHAVEVEVALCTESNFYVGFTENLSESGLFVATYCPQPIGSVIEIELHLPIGSIKVVGVVRWLRTSDAVGWPGMGIQFEGVSAEDEAIIREFLSVREPIFFADE